MMTRFIGVTNNHKRIIIILLHAFKKRTNKPNVIIYLKTIVGCIFNACLFTHCYYDKVRFTLIYL